jgi:hypothetical protein
MVTPVPRRRFLPWIWSHAFQIALSVLSLVVLAGNFVLLRENSKLKGVDAALMGEQTVAEGRILRGLGAASMDGRIEEAITASHGEQQLLIITFSPGCPYCRASQPHWSALQRQLALTGGTRVIWVSRDKLDLTRDYASLHHIPQSNVYAEPSYNTYMQLGLRAVPNMILADSGGKVTKVWSGGPNSEGWREIFSYFHTLEP